MDNATTYEVGQDTTALTQERLLEELAYLAERTDIYVAGQQSLPPDVYLDYLRTGMESLGMSIRSLWRKAGGGVTEGFEQERSI